MSSRKKNKKAFKSKSALSSENARRICDCEATKHPLVNNCINCGRIVCLSEGPGPCFFCDQMVCYNNEPLAPVMTAAQQPSNKEPSDSKHQKKSSSKGIYQPESGCLETLKLRDKLLEYDKDSASRTSVIDDECDYYQANNLWLTKEQREQWKKLEADTHEHKHRSRLLQKLSVDFTGRVQEEKDDPLELFNSMKSIQDDRLFEYDSSGQTNSGNFPALKAPVYISDATLPSNHMEKDENSDYVSNRIQDRGYLEISDQGVCLSMHQPYATLLVRGIKTTEGRTWYSSHRGRLWIASAAKEPNADEVSSIEAAYQHLSNEEVEFPKTYPTGCLLGCVTVTDVLSQEEYDKLHPNNHVDSPYVFVCENFFELPIKYPIQGKHKMYKLDAVIHRAALNCLEKTCMQMAKNAR